MTAKLRLALGELQQAILTLDDIDIDETGLWGAFLIVSDELKASEKADPLTAAAPDLLMVCRAFVAILEDPLLAKMDPILRMARAAVEKAEGK